MPAGVVADTHAIVWYLSAQSRLSDQALHALDAATAGGGQILLSAITLVELVYLVEKQRLPAEALERLLEELARPESAMAVVPVDAAVASAVGRVPRAAVPDMPDRIIAATAALLGLPLVSRDTKIRASGIETVW